ncbi:MAG: hypothetical protein ACR2OE_02300 [Thermomicrobiales bacterium]
MSKREMIESYLKGDLDRRGFIRGLTALGVSVGAATAYAVSFAPSALANADNGFVVRPGQRYQDQNYPPPPITLEEAVIQLVEAITALINLFAAALERFLQSDFTAAGLPSNAFATLQTILAQLNQQNDALNALATSGNVEVASLASGSAKGFLGQTDTVQGFLSELSDHMNKLVSKNAGIIPGLENGEARQTFTNIAMVNARQAAVVNQFAGEDPIPSAFAEPTLP